MVSAFNVTDAERKAAERFVKIQGSLFFLSGQTTRLCNPDFWAINAHERDAALKSMQMTEIAANAAYQQLEILTQGDKEKIKFVIEQVTKEQGLGKVE